jgi:hypothetical protein
MIRVIGPGVREETRPDAAFGPNARRFIGPSGASNVSIPTIDVDAKVFKKREPRPHPISLSPALLTEIALQPRCGGCSLRALDEA